MSLYEELLSVPYGLCQICDGYHSWQNVKCDLLEEKEGK